MKQLDDDDPVLVTVFFQFTFLYYGTCGYRHHRYVEVAQNGILQVVDDFVGIWG